MRLRGFFLLDQLDIKLELLASSHSFALVRFSCGEMSHEVYLQPGVSHGVPLTLELKMEPGMALVKSV